MRYQIRYVATDPIQWLTVHAPDSYSAFKQAIELMDTGKAIECIVFIADGNEWVKVANIRH